MTLIGRTPVKRLREIRLSTVIAVGLAVAGLIIGVCALITSNPFLGLFGITVTCCGGIAALVGLQE